MPVQPEPRIRAKSAAASDGWPEGCPLRFCRLELDRYVVDFPAIGTDLHDQTEHATDRMLSTFIL